MAAPKRKPASKSAGKPASKPAPSAGAGINARILVVEARYYNDISDALLAGAAKVLDEAKATWDIVTVPGSLEIVPAIAIAVDAAEKQKKPYDGVVALGCVIQGETFHFDIVAMQSARTLVDFSIAHRFSPAATASSPPTTRRRPGPAPGSASRTRAATPRARPWH